MAKDGHSGHLQAKVVEGLGQLEPLALLVAPVSSPADANHAGRHRAADADQARVLTPTHVARSNGAWRRCAARRWPVVGRAVVGVVGVAAVGDVAALLVGRQVVHRRGVLSRDG